MPENLNSFRNRDEIKREVSLTTYEIEKLELAADALEALATTSWGTRQRVFRRMLGLGRFKNPHPEHQVQLQSKIFSASDLIREKILENADGGNEDIPPASETAPPPPGPPPADLAHPETRGGLGFLTS